MSLDTVQGNYKRVAKLIKKVKDYPKDDPFFDLERSGFSLLERVYLMDQENAVFLEKAILDHAVVRRLMRLCSQQPGRGDDLLADIETCLAEVKALRGFWDELTPE